MTNSPSRVFFRVAIAGFLQESVTFIDGETSLYQFKFLETSGPPLLDKYRGFFTRAAAQPARSAMKPTSTMFRNLYGVWERLVVSMAYCSIFMARWPHRLASTPIGKPWNGFAPLSARTFR